MRTFQILDLIMPEFKQLMAMAASGGDEDSILASQLNPFKRKRQKPVVFWSSSPMDVSGVAHYTYQVPEYFNGNMRVMAVAAPQLIGITSNSTTVRGDFVLTPNTPTTLSPGDIAQVSVGVSNNVTGKGDARMPITLTLKTSKGLQVQGKASQTLNLAPRHEGSVTFAVKACEHLGSVKLEITASSQGAQTLSQSESISVRPGAAFRSQVDVGQVAAGANHTYKSLRGMYEGYSARTAAPSFCQPVAHAQCAGQTHPHTTGSRGRKCVALRSQFFNLLRSRQNDKGGFGLWAATPQADPFVSAYVMHVLIDACEQGVAVPQDLIEYLRELAQNDGLDDLSLMRERAYAVYLRLLLDSAECERSEALRLALLEVQQPILYFAT